MKLLNLLTALRTYWRTSNLGRRFKTRTSFNDWQTNRLHIWLEHHVSQVSFYHGMIDPHTSLRQMPIVDKAVLMSDFAAFNLAGLTSKEGWRAFEGDGRHAKWFVGASTGTSGNRGLYIISDRERHAWLGAMIGKLVPDAWRHPRKIAVILPLNSSLYEAAGQSYLLTLKFFNLTDGPEAWIDGLEAFNPDIIVAPPKILRWLVEENRTMTPEKVYSAAEVLDPIDRQIIIRGFPDLGQIYMATEGLLATSCPHGRLHLAEDVVYFEFEPAGDGLVSPIISDFTRTSQIMCRYRMNDLLRLDPGPCPCGSPFHVVAEIVGRQDDCFELDGSSGPILVTPDILRNAILDADRMIDDFRIDQTGPDTIRLTLDPKLRQASFTASAALGAALRARGCTPVIETLLEPLPLPTKVKRRRVVNSWKAGQNRRAKAA